MNPVCILIADDSPSMRQLLGDTLSEAGYKTLQACDGQDALLQLQSAAGVALAIIDVNMPNMDGLALLRALRESDKSRFVPILMLTTESRADKRAEARRSGATGWIMKPFVPDEVLATVQRLLRRCG